MDPADEEDRMNGSGCYETPANGNPPLIVAVGVAMSAALGFAIWSEIAEGRRDRKRAAERRLDSRGKAHSASYTPQAPRAGLVYEAEGTLQRLSRRRSAARE